MNEIFNLTPLIMAHIRSVLTNTHTGLPAHVVAYDHDQQRADVQPILDQVYRDGDTPKPSMILQSVPLWFSGASSGLLTFPIFKGTVVWLNFAERSLVNWKLSQGDLSINPEDDRIHDLNDVICTPGIAPFSQAYGSHPTDVVLRMNAGVNNSQNPGEHSIHLHPKGAEDAITLIANNYQPTITTIKLRTDGSVYVDVSDGTNIEIKQGSDIIINSPQKVQVNCETSEVNTSGNASITAAGEVSLDASIINMQGGGEKMLSSESINHVTGLPHLSGCATIFGSGGKT